MAYKLLFYSLLLIAGCHTVKETTVSEKNTLEKLIETNDIPSTDSLIIGGATITGDTLNVSFAYSGGCQEHEFSLYTNGAIAKSLPPQILLEIHHNSNRDKCRNFVRTTKSFDISSLKEKGYDKFIVRIKGYNKPLLYNIPKP